MEAFFFTLTGNWPIFIFIKSIRAMNIAIVGYGKMGKEIEHIALERKHQVTSIIDLENLKDIGAPSFRKADAAIEFTTPASAVTNIHACFNAGVPVVCGTTGWLDKLPEITEACHKHKLAFFHSPNFSLGVNILFWLNRELASRMNTIEGYEVSIDETHHTQKLDAPSGTAMHLANDIIGTLDTKARWVLDHDPAHDEIRIRAFREGTVPGNHTVHYESEFDFIELRHSAKSRKGLALGAMLAAEFIQGKTGCFTMKDLLNF
jgi:4-hydroxy-tetrahydrodipicolinate reductase